MKEPNSQFLRFEWGHHFVTVPLAIILFIGSVIYLINALQDGEQIGAALLLLITSLCLCFAVSRIRSYATKTQDRIIRMEEQFRYYRLTGHTMDPRVTAAQLIALRYAGDDEFVQLCERTAAESLKPEAIRAAIRNRRADTMRI